MNQDLTLSIIKPNAVRNKKIGKIISIFEKSNLTIKKAKLTTLNKSEAESFYKKSTQTNLFLTS